MTQTVLTDAFETLVGWSNGSIVAGGRTGNALQTNANITASRVFPAFSDHYIADVWYKQTGSMGTAGRQILAFVLGSSRQGGVSAWQDGSLSAFWGTPGGTIATSAPGLIVANTWYNIVFQLGRSSARGGSRIRLWLNGVLLVDGAGVASTDGAFIDQIELKNSPSAGQGPVLFDDLVLTAPDAPEIRNVRTSTRVLVQPWPQGLVQARESTRVLIDPFATARIAQMTTRLLHGPSTRAAQVSKVHLRAVTRTGLPAAEVSKVSLRAVVALIPDVPTVKVWSGTAFVDCPVRLWDGADFVDAEGTKVWSGTGFE